MYKLSIATLIFIIYLLATVPCGPIISSAAELQVDRQTPEEVPSWRLSGFSAALRDPNPAVFRQALLNADASLFLHQSGKVPKNQIDRIFEMLKHTAPYTSKAAVSALIAFKDLPAQQTARLIEMLLTADESTRSIAVQILSERKNTARTQAHDLVMQLKSASPTVRRAVSKVLIAWAGSLEHEVYHLGALLEDLDPSVRLASAQILAAMGSAAAEEAERLVFLISDLDTAVQAAGVDAISAIGETAIQVAPKVIKFLKHPAPEVKSRAIRMLASLGGSSEQYVVLISQRLQDVNVQVRITAAEVLAEMGGSASRSVAQLYDCFENPDPKLRASAFKALVAINGVATIPSLVFRAALKDVDTQVRLAAAGALKEQVLPAYAPQLLDLLADGNDSVRKAAGDALGNMKDGGLTDDTLVRLAGLLTDPNRLIRREAIRVFGIIGSSAKGYATHVVERIRDPDSQVAYKVGPTLAAMGNDVTVGLIPELIELLKVPDIEIASLAAFTISKLGSARLQHLDDLLALLEEPDSNVISMAGMAMAGITTYTVDEIPRLVDYLRDPNGNVRRAIMNAFYSSSPDVSDEWALAVARNIRDQLNTEDDNVRINIISIFMSVATYLGDSGRAFVPDLLAALEDGNVNVKSYAIVTIGAIMDNAGERFDQDKVISETLTDLLNDVDRSLRYGAVSLLSKSKQVAPIYLPLLVSLLNDPYYEIRTLAMETLERLEQCELKQVLLLLNAAATNESVTDKARYLAHLLGGGDPQIETLLTWLGRPMIDPIDRLGGDHGEAAILLSTFLEVWDRSESLPALRQELTRAIARVAQAVQWEMADVVLLEKHVHNLDAVHSSYASVVRQAIPSDGFIRGVHLVRNIWLVHSLFWLLLIFAYPKSPQIQAIFFWNPWIRRITGLGYVGMAMAWIPLLRNRLFAPFKESLLADAALEAFDADAYFKQSVVRIRNCSRLQPVIEAIPEIKGQLVLEGESGLGKTMFLRYLVKNSRRIVVFLSASRCENGVLEAVSAKLHGPAKDPEFLRNLLYAGSLDICIDGLNEVSAETRGRITAFLERYFKGNIILGTQHLEWMAPSTATTCYLQPLTQKKINSFLKAQIRVQQMDEPIDEQIYLTRCREYIARAFGTQQPREVFDATVRVLSNPMDLSTVAKMLAHGQDPNLFHLEQQQYEFMAKDYRNLHIRRPFPLEKFSEYVYQMRLKQNIVLSQEHFKAELECMERHKIVLARYQAFEGQTSQKVWYFRHDKLMEFFIVQAFLGEKNPRPQEHLGDPRFRGVYFLLAMLLPFTDAMVLREHLIDYAADTRDHTVSDTFIQLLRTRKAA